MDAGKQKQEMSVESIDSSIWIGPDSSDDETSLCVNGFESDDCGSCECNRASISFACRDQLLATSSVSVHRRDVGSPRYAFVCPQQINVLFRLFYSSRVNLRQCSMSDAFSELRRLVPTYPPDKKLSKTEILRLAIRYIKLLTSISEWQAKERTRCSCSFNSPVNALDSEMFLFPFPEFIK